MGPRSNGGAFLERNNLPALPSANLGPAMPDPFYVYVVDDDDSVRKALCRLLHASGYEVKTYASPERFLGELAPGSSGCLILDMTMPGMTGLQVQERMRKMGIALPVIAVSAHDDNQARESARKLGASFFLHKPVDDQALIDSISWVCESRAQPTAERR